MLEPPSTPPATDRLEFREWHLQDLDRFHVICSDPRVMRYVGDGRVWSQEQTSQFIQAATKMLRNCGYCQWALIHKANRQLIGYCGLAKSDELPEIGWRLSPEYWGQGLATEAAQAVLNHGLLAIGCSQIIATVQAENTASIRVIEKLGMSPSRRMDRMGREVVVYTADKKCLTS